MNFLWMKRRISEEQERSGGEVSKKEKREREESGQGVREGMCTCVRTRINQGARRDQGCKEITHSGSMIQQENQNRVIISQPAISLAYLFAAAVLLSTEI